MTQWFIGNLVTGVITHYLPITTGSWETELNAAGTVTVTVPLHDPDVARIGVRNAATVGKTFLAVAENGIILNAGPVWSHDYSADDGTVQLSAKGLWSLYDHRAVLPKIPSGVTSPAGYDTTLTNLDTGTIVKRVVQQALLETGASLPVVFQDDVSGTSQASYLGADLHILADVLNDLVTNGVDIEFAPQFTTDGTGIQWLLRTGTDAVPQLSSPTTQVWDMSVPQASVKGLDVTVDASALTGRVWETTGSGASDALYSRHDNTNLIAQGYPFYESVDSSHNDVKIQATLDGYAVELARVGSLPTELWKFDVKTDEQPYVGSYRAGDWCVLKVGTDPYIPKGQYSRRITNLSGDQDSQWVSVTTGQTYSLTG